MEHIFLTFIYQPFLNLLVLFYWLLGQIPGSTPDMGIAVVLLTIVIRIILLPLTFSSDRSEKERHEIELKVKHIQEELHADPVAMNAEIKKLLRTNPRILISETVEFTINVIITLMLIRMFATGLEGKDLNLLYRGLPDVPQPYNLIFLGKFDLAKPNFVLNLTQSLVILVVEIVAEFTSPFRNLQSAQADKALYNPVSVTGTKYARATRSRVKSLQFFLPVVSFLVFMFLPAGKKLFIITTLLFSLVYMLLGAFVRKMKELFPAPEPIVADVVSPQPPTTPH